MNENLASIWLFLQISKQNESNFKMAQQSEIRVLSILRRDGSFSSKIDLCSWVAVWPKNRAVNTLNALWIEEKKSLFDHCIAIAKHFKMMPEVVIFNLCNDYIVFFFLHSLNSTSFFFSLSYSWFILRIFNHKIK